MGLVVCMFSFKSEPGLLTHIVALRPLELCLKDGVVGILVGTPAASVDGPDAAWEQLLLPLSKFHGNHDHLSLKCSSQATCESFTYNTTSFFTSPIS